MKMKLLLGHAQQFVYTIEGETLDDILVRVKEISYAESVEATKVVEPGYPEGTIFLKLNTYPKQLVPIYPI